MHLLKIRLKLGSVDSVKLKSAKIREAFKHAAFANPPSYCL